MLQSIREAILVTIKGFVPFAMVTFVLAMAACLFATYLQRRCELVGCSPSLESLDIRGG